MDENSMYGQMRDEEPQQTTEFLNDRREDIFPVAIQVLHPEARAPKKSTLESAGYDLFCVESFSLYPGETKAVPLGFSTQMPSGIHGRIESRSGLALRGLVVLTGVIDADYRGEWHVILRNLNMRPEIPIVGGSGPGKPFEFAAGDKIAQVVFRPTVDVHFEVADALSRSERGAGGFGSTGR